MKKTFQGKGVKRVDFSYNSGDRKLNNRAFLVAAKDGLIALSPVCTHLGCLVNWDKNKGDFYAHAMEESTIWKEWLKTALHLPRLQDYR